MSIAYREHRIDLVDQDGNIVERDVLHITGTVVRDGVLFAYTIVPPSEPNEQQLRLLKKMVAAELETEGGQ